VPLRVLRGGKARGLFSRKSSSRSVKESETSTSRVLAKEQDSKRRRRGIKK
jgi:hypothetical protein